MRRKRSLKNKVLITLNYIIGTLCIFAVTAIDTQPGMISKIVFIGLIWFILFIYANRDLQMERDEDV